MATETSQGLTHTYTYDLGGRRTGTALGTGKSIATTFDSQGKPLTVTEGGRTTVYHYDLASRAVAQTQPNGLWQYNAYDDLGRLESRQTYTNADALQAQFLWTYDAVGNVTVQSERWPGEGTRGAGWRSTVMVYDATNRLTGEAMAQPGSPVVTTGYAYDTGSNRSVKLVSTDGSLTTQTLTVTGQSAQTTTYHWDAENRLEGVTLPNADEHEYGYDYRTRRISRVENGIGTAIVFSGGLSVAEYESPGITPTVEYLRGPDMGGGVGGMMYSLRNGGTEAKYAMSNGRGDVVAQSNDAGALTWTASYEAYGKRPVETGTNLDRQRANTKEEDPTGLLNEGFRYRDIETGVWLSRDPAGFVDGPNLYAYVRQNPWTAFDPEGLSDTWTWGGWVDYTGVGTAAHLIFDAFAVPIEAVGELIRGMDQAMADAESVRNGEMDLLEHEVRRRERTMDGLEPAMTLATSMPGTTLSGPVSTPGATGVVRMTLPMTTAKNSLPFTSKLLAQGEKLVEAIRMRAAAAIKSQSNRQRGPVLTGVMDSKTGKMFFGQNSIDGSLPDNLHPILQKRLDELGEGAGGRAGVAGSHSEIEALNQALHARGSGVTEGDLGEFLLHNRALRGERKGTGRPPRCDNCRPLTDGVTVVDIDE